jgi:bifunctional non-homologous end joining protein LigD
MSAKISRYKAKRDFGKTAEPGGSRKVRPSKVGRFVIQKYAATCLHYDLRLEVDGVSKSWRSPSDLRSTHVTGGLLSKLPDPQ